MESFDVWVIAFRPPPGTDLVRELSRVFGLDEAAARQLEQTVPRAVKRNATREQADQMRAALVAIGATVDVRPHRARSDGALRPVAPAAPGAAEPPAAAPVGAPAAAAHVPLGEVVDESEPVGAVAGAVANRFLPGIGAIIGGLLVLGFRLAIGSSAFLGTSGIFGLAIDATGLSSILVGIYYVLFVALRDASTKSVGQPGALLTTFSFGLVFLINCYVATSPAAPLDEDDVSELVDDGELLPVRSVLADPAVTIPGVGRERMDRLLAELTTAGATRVLAEPAVEIDGQKYIDSLFVELPEDFAARARVAAAYRAFLGFRASELSEEELRAGDGERLWYITVSFEEYDDEDE